ncbi:phytanoyl-CoA dioxygenase family protein [Streptomyces bluensis]|uniref:phytanoyl-CoA dioxygenase family protein n=1 Tax=Streptomyces bluensis TaxID=33897 RepID=UPI00167883EB|nr:phytanoyl-CoA dioxygenase family protein [Streptomyces bluensis]GGZ70102.1 hypothetical protein GCM10010344_41360 [Streptomyces bluensis]
MTATATALRRDGYAVLPGLIDPTLLGDFATQLDARLQPLGPGDPLARLRAGQPGIQQLRAAGYDSKAQHRLTHYPALATLMADLLSGEVWAQPRRFLRLAAPGPGPWATEPHQDYRYVQGAIDTLTAWVPLHELEAPAAVGQRRGGLPLAHRPLHSPADRPRRAHFP